MLRIHWYPIANQNHFVLFISLLIAPIAAKQGAHRRLNTRKEYAAIVQSCCLQVFPRFLFRLLQLLQIRITVPNVPTTFSFATRSCDSCNCHLPVTPSKWCEDPCDQVSDLSKNTLSLGCFHSCSFKSVKVQHSKVSICPSEVH